MNTPDPANVIPMRPPAVAMRRSLNGHFVDFPMLPLLLRKARRLAERETMQDCWSEHFERKGFDSECQRLDDSADAGRMAQDVWRLANFCGLLDAEGLTGAGRQLAARKINLAETLAHGVRWNLIGQDGQSIIVLLLRGAAKLAATDHPWARFCPGLLTLEMSAIVYWACINGRKCERLLSDLVTWRDVAMHRYGEPDPGLSAEEGAAVHFKAMSDFYLEHEWLAERAPMGYGEEFAMAKLLDFSELLKAKWLGGNRLCLVPPEFLEGSESAPPVP